MSTFGESAIDFSDVSSNVGESFISTGSRSLNNILTGNTEIGIVQRRIYEMYGPEGCISGKSFISYETKTKSGRRINHKGGKIRGLYKKFHSNKDNNIFYTSSVNNDNRIIKQEILDVVETGFKECFELETVSGNKISATNTHEFKTENGYIELKDLVAGDAVYIHNNTHFKKQHKHRKKRNGYIVVNYHPSEKYKLHTVILRGKKYSYTKCKIGKANLIYEANLNNMNEEDYKFVLNNHTPKEINNLRTIKNGFVLHHKDENPLNNKIDNLEVMSKLEHDKLHANKNHNNLRFVAVLEKIKSIKSVGSKMTYDIKCHAPYHNYIANRFVIHNCGKTTIALEAVSSCQKNGGTAMIIDAEHALDPSYCKKLGIELNDVYVAEPNCGEQTFDMIEWAIKNDVDLVVVDSVAAMTPKGEIEGDMGDSNMGLHARLMGQGLRRTTNMLTKKRKTSIIFTNQLRMKIGVMFGNPETRPGGRALKYFTSGAIIDLRDPRGQKTTEDKVETGKIINAKTTKNKLFQPFLTCKIHIEYGKGIVKIKDMLQVLSEKGVCEFTKKTVSFNDYARMNLESFRDSMKTDKVFRKYIKQLLSGENNVNP